MKLNKSSTQREWETELDQMELFVADLKDVYWAEKTLVKSMPKMIHKELNKELKGALQKYLSAAEKQVLLVVKVFELISMKAQAANTGNQEHTTKLNHQPFNHS